MHLQLRLDGNHPRQWHLGLLQALAARPGLSVSANMAPGPESLPPAAGLLFRFEALLQHIAPTHAEPLAAGALAAFSASGLNHPDLVLDLCGDVQTTKSRIWCVKFSGASGESALLGLLLGGHWPVVTLEEAARTILSGRPGSERGDVMLAAFNDVLGRTKAMILKAIAAHDQPSAAPMPAGQVTPSGLSTRALGASAARQLTWKLVRRLYQMAFSTPHWRTGWRKLNGPDMFDLRQHPPGGWTNLPDDSTRFYADPFPFVHEGRLSLFVEDFPHATGKGLISAVEFGPDGPLGTPRPVLELGCHLSYPFVFASEGQIWMIPETSGAGTVELHRATQFPGGWVREAILLDGLVAGDVTLTQHQGQWWMFATVQHEGGSFSDALHLWSAPNFTGPWTPHPRNPVLVDMASARPAGRIVNRNGAMFRPVQDCRAGYGAALGIARITRLDHEGYDQTVETLLGPGPLWPGRRLHTLNSAGGFEFIDGSGRARRF